MEGEFRSILCIILSNNRLLLLQETINNRNIRFILWRIQGDKHKKLLMYLSILCKMLLLWWEVIILLRIAAIYFVYRRFSLIHYTKIGNNVSDKIIIILRIQIISISTMLCWISNNSKTSVTRIPWAQMKDSSS